MKEDKIIIIAEHGFNISEVDLFDEVIIHITR